MAGETLTLLEEAKQLASKGELAAARDKFGRAAEEASAEEQHEAERDAILGMAESQWQLGETGGALLSYEAALSATRKAKDEAGEGMVLLGKGFALMSLGRGPAACEAFATSASIAERNGHGAQHKFALDLLQQAKRLPAPAAAHEHSAHASHSSAQTKAHADAQETPQVELSGESAGVSGGAGGGAMSSAAVAEAFVRSYVAKGAMVLVMKGTPEVPACGFSRDAAQALDGIGAVYGHLDIEVEAELAAAFKAQFAWPTFPMLFVNARLFGGRDVICQLEEEGSLESALREALAASLPAPHVHLLFSPHPRQARQQPEGGGGARGQCQSKHEARLRRMVVFCAARVTRRGEGYDAGEADAEATAHRTVLDLLSEQEGGAEGGGGGRSAEELVPAFLSLLSETLGGFVFPATVLEEAGTVGALVGWIEAHCPAQGDCKACPTRHSCSAHALAEAEPDPAAPTPALQDLEDLHPPPAPSSSSGAICGIPKLHASRKSRPRNLPPPTSPTTASHAPPLPPTHSPAPVS